jgi:hypothetical protein
MAEVLELLCRDRIVPIESDRATFFGHAAGPAWVAVIVSDVSDPGVRLSGSELPEQETQILLRVGDLPFAGRVAWSVGTSCGIELRQPLSPEQLASLRRRDIQGQMALC